MVPPRDLAPGPSRGRRTASGARRGPTPVDSNLIRSVGYDLQDSVLEIEFVEGGRVYEYSTSPSPSSATPEAFKGQYFNEFIKDLYAYQETE